jgi:ribose 5-phosphate isomerase B
MIISLGADHAGYELKDKIKAHLLKKGYEVIDEGTNGPESVDYPVFANKVAQDVVRGKANYGIVCCGSAEGISIAANKVNGIRCGIGYNDEVTSLLRQHNDANMIAFAGRFMTDVEVLPRVDTFLNTDFLGGRHQIRIDEIKALEER